jgi:hypothetical protein
MLDVVVKQFDNADETRTFEKGKFEVINIGFMTIGRATYDPGWKWSAHVGKALGKKSCDVEHVCLIISGRAAVAMDDGRVIETKAGDLVYIPPATTAGSWKRTLRFAAPDGRERLCVAQKMTKSSPTMTRCHMGTTNHVRLERKVTRTICSRLHG